jgi:hypothetical protein
VQLGCSWGAAGVQLGCSWGAAGVGWGLAPHAAGGMGATACSCGRHHKVGTPADPGLQPWRARLSQALQRLPAHACLPTPAPGLKMTSKSWRGLGSSTTGGPRAGASASCQHIRALSPPQLLRGRSPAPAGAVHSPQRGPRQYPPKPPLHSQRGGARLSLSWTRILPGGGRGSHVNRAGVKFYANLLSELHAAGITPVVTLFHCERGDRDRGAARQRWEGPPFV